MILFCIQLWVYMCMNKWYQNYQINRSPSSLNKLCYSGVFDPTDLMNLSLSLVGKYERILLLARRILVMHMSGCLTSSLPGWVHCGKVINVVFRSTPCSQRLFCMVIMIWCRYSNWGHYDSMIQMVTTEACVRYGIN